MIYLIDSATPEDVSKVLEFFPAEGVTTNPAIVSRTRCDFPHMLREMREVIGDRMLHAQTLQTRAEDMVREAIALNGFVGGEFYVKLPASREGLKACRELKRRGVGVTVTAVFDPQQALIAARAGADFVAPYVNKLDDVGNGVECVRRIRELFNIFNLPAKVLSASFRNVNQVTEVALAGSDYVTLPPAFFDKLIWHPMTDNAIEGFQSDWRAAYGENLPEDMLHLQN